MNILDTPMGDAKALVGLADAQLYEAEHAGRGRVSGAPLGAAGTV